MLVHEGGAGKKHAGFHGNVDGIIMTEVFGFYFNKLVLYVCINSLHIGSLITEKFRD